MGEVTFQGPIKAGTIKHTTGTTLGTMAYDGGPGNVANVGQVIMAQTYEYSQVAAVTPVATTIVIPAGSQIVDIKGVCTETFDGANTLISLGTNAAGTNITGDLFGQGANPILEDWVTSVVGNDQGGNMTVLTTGVGGYVLKDVGATDVKIWMFPTVGDGTTGRLTLTALYLQAMNLT
jgi:hypothetical protein